MRHTSNKIIVSMQNSNITRHPVLFCFCKAGNPVPGELWTQHFTSLCFCKIKKVSIDSCTYNNTKRIVWIQGDEMWKELKENQDQS